MDIFHWFYQPAQFFVGEPTRAYGVAGFFAILAILTLVFQRKYKIARPLVILGPAPGWALFGWLEQVSQAAQWNIRVDLLVTWPTIVVLSATCLILWILGFGIADTPKKLASRTRGVSQNSPAVLNNRYVANAERQIILLARSPRSRFRRCVSVACVSGRQFTCRFSTWQPIIMNLGARVVTDTGQPGQKTPKWQIAAARPVKTAGLLVLVCRAYSSVG